MHEYTYEPGLLTSVMSVVGALAAFAATIYFIVFHDEPVHFNPPRPIRERVGDITAGWWLAGFLAVVMFVGTHLVSHTHQREQYKDAVAQWLDETHGLIVTRENVAKLVTGESIFVIYDDGRVNKLRLISDGHETALFEESHLNPYKR